MLYALKIVDTVLPGSFSIQSCRSKKKCLLENEPVCESGFGKPCSAFSGKEYFLTKNIKRQRDHDVLEVDLIEILKVDVHKFTINKKDSEASNISVLNLSPNSLILDALLTLNKIFRKGVLPDKKHWSMQIFRQILLVKLMIDSFMIWLFSLLYILLE
jgi:hypothetical protein